MFPTVDRRFDYHPLLEINHPRSGWRKPNYLQRIISRPILFCAKRPSQNVEPREQMGPIGDEGAWGYFDAPVDAHAPAHFLVEAFYEIHLFFHESTQ